MFKTKMKGLLIAVFSVMFAVTSAMGLSVFADETKETETQELAPLAWYNFSDTENLGKDATGNYNLTLTTRSGGAITAAEGGGVKFDGNSILFSKNSDGGLGNALNGKNYTLIATFRPDSDNNGNSGIVGFGRNDWGQEGSMLRTNGGGLHLRYGASGNRDGGNQIDQDWGPDIGDMSTTEDTVAAISIEMGGRGHVYMNGSEKFAFNVTTDWTNCGAGGRFCIGGQYRNMWIGENSTFEVAAVECFKGIVRDVKIYDELLSADEIASVTQNGKALAENLAKASAFTPLDFTQTVSVSDEDTHEQILALANSSASNKAVSVTMSDESVRSGLITWTSVLTEDGKTYVEAPIDFVYNPESVKARAEISVAHYDVINPLAKYEFTDAENPGKDSLGNFDLVKFGNGNITIENGAATFDGNAALAPANNRLDISEYLSSFTLLFEINKTTETNAYWSTPIGFGFVDGVEQWSTFHFAENSPRLRYTVSNALVDGVSDIDGHNNMYWGHDIADVTVGSYDKVALTVEAGGKLCVYFNGTLISSKVFDVPKGYNMANELLRFAIGGVVDSNGMRNGFIGSFKNVTIYDFALNETQVSTAQNAGVIKTNVLSEDAVTVKSIGTTITFADDEVLSGTAYDKMTDDEIISLLNQGTVKAVLTNRQNRNIKVMFTEITQEDGVYYAVGKAVAGVGYPSIITGVTVKQEIEVTASHKITLAGEHGTVACDYITSGDHGYFAAGVSKTLTITATPDDGYVLKAIKVNGETIEAQEGVYSYVATGDTEITAEFAKVHAITKKDAVNGTFTVSAEQAVDGEKAEIIATPAEGYKVAAVKVNGEIIEETDGKYTFTVKADSEVEVEFAELEKFNVTVKESQNGEVTLSQKGEVTENTVIEITATPAEGYKVAAVKVNGEKIEAVNGKYTFTLKADSEVEVEFAELTKFNVTVKESQNGEVTLSKTGEVIENTVIEITATPANGYVIDAVKVNGEIIEETDGKYTFTVKADSEVEVTFKAEQTSGSGCFGSVDYPSMAVSLAALAMVVMIVRKKRA